MASRLEQRGSSTRTEMELQQGLCRSAQRWRARLRTTFLYGNGRLNGGEIITNRLPAGGMDRRRWWQKQLVGMQSSFT